MEEIETAYQEKVRSHQKNVSNNVDPKLFPPTFTFRSFSDTAAEITLKVIDTFTTQLPFLFRISVTKRNTAWISCWEIKTLHEIELRTTMPVVHTYVDKVIYDMATTQQGDLLLTILSDTNLYRLNDSGLLTSVHDFNPLIPKAVCVSKESIIVSTREGGEAWPVTNSSQRQCVFLDPSGKKKVKIVEYDSNRKQLFTLISRVTTNNKYIVAVDSLSDYFGRIVALKNSSIKWTYEGNEEVNKHNPLNPHDIVATPKGNIIVADVDSHALHFLSDDGVLLKCIRTKDLNIIFPLSLDIDSTGRLWIGCSKYRDHPNNAKLHNVECTGC